MSWVSVVVERATCLKALTGLKQLPWAMCEYKACVTVPKRSFVRLVSYVGNAKVDLDIQGWTGFVGEMDTRLWKNQDRTGLGDLSKSCSLAARRFRTREKRPVSPRYPEDYVGLRPGYVKPASLAWYAFHQHTADGLNQPYRYSYLFAYALNAPGSAKTLKLPNNDKIRILSRIPL